MRTGDVFELLRDGRPWTRSELAETTGLARSTVAARIDTLMRLGLIAPFGGGQSTGGRPPALFALNPAARVVVGVDVGATHARAVLSDLSGAPLCELSEQIHVAAGPEVVLGWVVSTIRSLLRQASRQPGDLAAIGIGLPGPVEHSTGRPINPPIMPGWDRYDVPGFLQQHFSVPVLVDNDVNIMALGERAGHVGSPLCARGRSRVDRIAWLRAARHRAVERTAPPVPVVNQVRGDAKQVMPAMRVAIELGARSQEPVIRLL